MQALRRQLVDSLQAFASLYRNRSLRRLQLAWIGSSSTLQGLERIQPVLERLGRAYPSLRLQLICD